METFLNGSGAVGYGLLLLVVVALILPLRRWLHRRAWRRVSARWILIDGSNVMHWQDNRPDLGPVRQAVEALSAMGYVPAVVFDANVGWKLMGRYLDERELARLLDMERRQVLVVPKGVQADPYLLATASEFAARIVTNDRYRDWADAYPRLQEPGFLIRGGIRDGKVWLKGMGTQKPA